jgi:cytochrome oxidase assembly protein ShyY1
LRRFGPRWIVATVLVAAIVFGCIEAGFWQLRRLDQRRARNAQVVARSQQLVRLPPVGFEDADDTGGDDGDHGEDLWYRRVRVTGTFDADHEVLVRFRTRKGLPGYEVLTPLVVEGVGDRRAVVVDRGWVPLELGDHWPQRPSAPPAGVVEVEGILGVPEEGALRLEQPTANRPIVVATIAPDGLRSVLPYDRLYRVPLLAEDGATSGSAAYPAPVDPPDLGEGPHFNYAVQWFLFASVGIVGYPLLLRRRGPLAKRREVPTLDP